jgi:peptidyl-prolyl cis-trans isomerase C
MAGGERKRPFWREPLLHFLLVGAALYGVHRLSASEPADPPIVIDEAFVAGLERQQVQRTGRAPQDEASTEALIDEHVREEVLLREALRLGLEQDDPIVRRRLVQKMELLLGAAAEPEEPSDAALQAHLEAHPERFARSERLAFTQVFFSTERREDALGDARAALDALAEGGEANALGDPLPLGRRQPPTPPRAIAGRYGEAFAEAVAALEPGSWSEPIESPLGVHLVRLESREPGRGPALAEARTEVKRDWRREKRSERHEAAIRRLVERAEVVRP